MNNIIYSVRCSAEKIVLFCMSTGKVCVRCNKSFLYEINCLFYQLSHDLNTFKKPIISSATIHEGTFKLPPSIAVSKST